MGFAGGGFGRSYAGGTDLAGFYQRQGETAKAEGLLQKELAEAKAPQEAVRSLQRYGQFLISQQRWEEGAAQWEKLIALQSASARPEDRQMLAYSRVNLAHALMAGGKAEEALEIVRAHVAQSNGDAYQRADALRTYAGMLIQQQQLEEAEKVLEQIRQPSTSSGKNAAEMAKQAETMTDHLLADIRQRQNRGDEALALRARAMARVSGTEGAGAPVPLWNLLQPVQELMRRQKYDEAMAQAQQILAEGLPRLRSHPQEIGAFANLIHSLPQGRQEERLQWIRTLLTTLDGLRPADHPQVAQALGQFVGSAMQAGLSAGEITRLLESEEKILVASKGEDSPALNDVSRRRAQFFSFRGDYADAAAEMKRALKRTEAASGAKSQMTLQMMRELTGTLQMTNESWPEEERLRLALIERSGPSMGMGGSVVQDMSTLAGRYFAVGQRENAVSWMDRAIELAKKNPHTASAVQGFEQQRNHFASSQNQVQPSANPFYGPAPGRWFNTGDFSTTQGVRLGNRAVPGVGSPTTGTPLPPPPPPKQ
jgi:tetratricopeptide (TPR) repeat protein